MFKFDVIREVIFERFIRYLCNIKNMMMSVLSFSPRACVRACVCVTHQWGRRAPRFK